jgi:hypothetical protein
MADNIVDTNAGVAELADAADSKVCVLIVSDPE